MKKYLKNDEDIRIIATNEDKEECLNFLKKDVWSIPYIEELSIREIPDTPMFYGDIQQNQISIKKCSGIEISVPPVDNSIDEIEESSKSNGFLLSYPFAGADSTLIGHLTRYTAFPSICARAGLSGTTITNFDKKKTLSPLPPVEKAQWLSRGFSLHKSLCKVLYRDGKISAVLSQEYAIIPAYETVPVLEDILALDHPEYSFCDGQYSHEYLLLNYNLNDAAMEGNFKYMLENAGMQCDSVKAGVQFSTSDIGESSVTARAYYIVNGTRMPLGRPIAVKHDSGHTTSDFETAIQKLGMLFKENEDRIEELGNTEIHFADGCFLNIIEKNKNLKVGSESIAEHLRLTYPEGCSCTAIDIYLAINEILEEKNKKKPLSPTQWVNLSEEIAKLMFMDFTTYDHPYNPEA